MSLLCPHCKSRNLRYARIRSFAERLGTLVGIRPLRCRDCRTRFIERTWRLSAIRYARCPRCWREDLTRWSLNDYCPPAGVRLLLSLGAHPFRCAYCRVNFVSFRRRRLKYVRNKQVLVPKKALSREAGAGE
ncbi:MAG: hypothetical protein ACM336_08760 [Acidobacteriota bacterium]